MSWDQGNLDADVTELQQRLAAVRQQLRKERVERERLASRLAKLERRRSVRMTLAVADTARPPLQLVRQLRWQWRTRRRRQASTGSPGRTDETGATNPFFAQAEPLVGRQALDQLEPGWQDGIGATPWHRLQGKDGPLVSIVMVVSDPMIPVEPSLQSILHQSYSRWELLLRDGTGQDGWKLPIEARDSRVTVGRLRSTHAGVARNHGLAAARGEMIAYLDPPNLWHPRFLEKLVAALVGDWARYTAYGDCLDAAVLERGDELVWRTSPNADYAELVQQGVIALNAVIHRRGLYDEIGGASKSSSIGPDRDLLLKYTFLREPLRVGGFLLLQPSTDAVEADGNELPSAPALRTSAELFFRERYLEYDEAQRPALTVVGGVSELAHEKAWDLAAVAGEVAPTQLVAFRFGKSVYAPRFLPSPETGMIRLDGGRFPGWAAALARAVANVHGEVVYAAEPRLPSLGLALLASYHHGVPIVADLSHPPVIGGDVSESRSAADQQPLSLDEVDPSDDALLEPRSPLWDRIMAGIAQELPVWSVDSLPQAGGAPSNLLLVHHPKDETVFDASLHDRELARCELGLRSNERVVLCGGPVAAGWAAGERLDLLDALAVRFRLLLLATESSPAHFIAHRLDRSPTVIDRADEGGVVTAMAASDALLLWGDPGAPAAHEGLPPELGSALAMELPVIANDLGGLGDLGRGGYLQLVPFGDVESLVQCLDRSGCEGRQQSAQVAAGRHLFMRQFSHAAASVHVGMVLRTVEREGDALGLTEEFARFFSDFYRHYRTTGLDR